MQRRGGEYDKGQLGEEGWRKDGGGKKKRWGGGMREGRRKDGEGGMGDVGDGGRVSDWWWWWVMKYSVRVCLWLLPLFFFPLSLSTSLADSFIYWGPCGSRNSFAVVLPLHTKRTKGGR